MLESVLLWAVILLLLVVLAPAGVALYQRIKTSDSDRPKGGGPKGPAGAGAAPIPPLPPPSPTPAAAAPVPAAPKVAPPPESAPPPAPLPPAAPAAKPPASDMDATRMASPLSNPEQRGTEMVQWYGMLQCTSGLLEGQRFIIEPGGLYIGRDPSLAQIAIPDSRISKRHLRIVPRDGKVWAIDQNSTNGTFLGKPGGERLTEHELKRGDTLILADGAATFVYQI